jgi:hypothetical protein
VELLRAVESTNQTLGAFAKVIASDTRESGDVTTDVSPHLLSFFFSLRAGLAGDKPNGL